jgi:hypothetical protein
MPVNKDMVHFTEMERSHNGGPQDGEERNMDERESFYISGSNGCDASADYIIVARKNASVVGAVNVAKVVRGMNLWGNIRSNFRL